MLRLELKKHIKKIGLVSIVFPVLVNLLLFMSLKFRYYGYLLPNQETLGLTKWQLIFKEQSVFYGEELHIIVIALIILEVFSIEFKNNAWTGIVTSQFRQSIILKVKFFSVIFYSLVYWISNNVSIMVVGFMTDKTLLMDLFLFIKVVSVQIFATVMLVSFYFLFLMLVRKINFLIPVSVVLFIFSISIYYQKLKYILVVPTTYISHAFRANNFEIVLMIICSTILSFVSYTCVRYFIERSYQLEG